MRRVRRKAENLDRSLRPEELTGRAVEVHARQRRVGFPDPEAGPNGAVGLPLIENSDGSLTAEGKSFSGPALRKAERMCALYLPPAGGPPPRVAAAEHRRELTEARCMRAHGVPNFPDPSSSGSSQAPSLAGIDTQSPA